MSGSVFFFFWAGGRGLEGYRALEIRFRGLGWVGEFGFGFWGSRF